MDELTHAQAQAIADVLRTVDNGCDQCIWSAAEEMKARFPAIDWYSLCFDYVADPRSLLPKEPAKAIDLAQWDRAFREGYVEPMRAALDRPTSS